MRNVKKQTLGLLLLTTTKHTLVMEDTYSAATTAVELRCVVCTETHFLSFNADPDQTQSQPKSVSCTAVVRTTAQLACLVLIVCVENSSKETILAQGVSGQDYICEPPASERSRTSPRDPPSLVPGRNKRCSKSNNRQRLAVGTLSARQGVVELPHPFGNFGKNGCCSIARSHQHTFTVVHPTSYVQSRLPLVLLANTGRIHSAERKTTADKG